MDFNNKKHLMIIGAFIAILAIIYYVVFIWDTKVDATYTPKVDVCHCESNECNTLNVALVARVAHLAQHEDDYAGQCNEPSVTPSVEPSVSPEPTVTETPTATPSPTNTPENKQDVSDMRSDGRSDGLCSKPPCVPNGAPQTGFGPTLYPEVGWK